MTCRRADHQLGGARSVTDFDADPFGGSEPAADRPTPSCAARTIRPRGQTTTLSSLHAGDAIAGSILTPPLFIQNTVSFELDTRMLDSPDRCARCVTRFRSP